MDPELFEAIGQLTVTGAHLETSVLRLLVPLSGMQFTDVVAFVGRMHAEPLMETVQRMLQNRQLREDADVPAEWKPIKGDLAAFFSFRGRVAHTTWVLVQGSDGSFEYPHEFRAWRRETSLDGLPNLSVQEIREWRERGELLLGRLRLFFEALEARA